MEIMVESGVLCRNFSNIRKVANLRWKFLEWHYNCSRGLRSFLWAAFRTPDGFLLFDSINILFISQKPWKHQTLR